MARVNDEMVVGNGSVGSSDSFVATKTVTKSTREAPPKTHAGLPHAQGLYDPSQEHDACGVGFIAQLKGVKSHSIIENGLHLLENLEHRGAVGADPLMGDGAGMLVQIPHQFFSEEAQSLGFSLPAPGEYAVGFLFMPQDVNMRTYCEAVVARVVKDEGQVLLGWRDVPVDNSCLSQDPLIMATEPVHRQVFIGKGDASMDQDAFERRLFILRKVISNAIYKRYGAEGGSFYPVSLSSRTVIYKGMFLADQLGKYYKDLKDPRFVSALALVHQRFSTNTFPSWKLAHPYRMVAHNGEINTLRGNVNWMAARQASASSVTFGEDIHKLWPISYEGQSDTACFDNALEFLVQGGYALEHAAMMLIPEAWVHDETMEKDRRAFYEYHAALMEPWDGPAAVAFTDGRKIGATLDRNGLRPARYLVTDDDMVVMASEAGVLPISEEKIVKKWRLQPGKMLLIDLEAGTIINDGDIKAYLASLHPYEEWLRQAQIKLEELPDVPAPAADADASLLDRQQAFGYSQEDVKLLMTPMALTGMEAVGSMGTDTPIAALSDKPKLLYNYFKQNFAQVTNPPIDPIREETVMSLVSFIGPRPNLFDLDGHSTARRLEVSQPILTNRDLAKIRAITDMPDNHFVSRTFDILFDVSSGPQGMMAALDGLCIAAEGAVREGTNIIILSDRGVSATRAPIPALLATAGVHHHLIRKGLRTSVGLVVESGEPREVHHFAVLAGYGAEAINPYLAFETLTAMAGQISKDAKSEKIVSMYIKSIGKGLLKVMSKMGISTYQSYCGAQIFDAIGLSQSFIDEFFSGTSTKIEGIGLEDVAYETVERHKAAFGNDPVLARSLEVGGEYAYRQRGEAHMWTPQIVADLQHAARGNLPDKYRAFAEAVNEESGRYAIRGHFRIKSAADMGYQPVPLDEVEPASEIVKRFSTGAMSFGSISREAHTTLAIAMNQIGGKSNTGEGGEEPERLKAGQPHDHNLRSSIKQVASGRFGVTTEYLVNSDVMQIKVAQGAKPGEGGQLPGHKVDAVIAKVRHSTPGVGLISPPPHHDIYSIEDLAQLIFDLKNVNPQADVSVKLVSEVGVGTVAAGVAKARADHITISGYDGGTGASPLTSLKHAGSPWEMGLAETQQTLVLNGLRSRVILQVDGGIRTGRDVLIGALLGADEVGFATAPLIAAGCVMMRKCHLNTCPVGIATQDPVLRARFKGTPEHVINYFFFVAEEVRELLAAMGFRSYVEAIGRSDMLAQRHEAVNSKAQGLDFAKIFYKPKAEPEDIRHSKAQIHPIDKVLDRKLIEAAKPALTNRTPVRFHMDIANSDRSTGAMISGEVAKRFGHAGLADDTIHIDLTGTAGQAFGAFVARGVTLDLTGAGNDYVGKGLSGGRIIVKPDPAFRADPSESIIVGNTVLYGATEGDVYFCGVAGERFSVRNSGALAVVEGVGDHGCEYMTGGVVLVLGLTGRNFAAGMSGGLAYIYDEAGDFAKKVNGEMVDVAPIALEGEMGKFASLDDLKADMLRDDEKRVKTLIERHAAFTGSKKAKALLADWAQARTKFVKVLPREYRRALLEMEQARLATAAE